MKRDVLPPIKLDHLINMTDEFGMIQFCEYSKPNLDSGYTIDDNSRALNVAILHNRIFKNKTSLNLAKIYLNFIEHCQDKKGNFMNNICNKNEILDPISDDAFGRTIWALGFTINKTSNKKISDQAKILLDKAMPNITKLKDHKSTAFCIIGLYHYYKKFPNKQLIQLIQKRADYLLKRFKSKSSNNWQWFDEILAYSNSKVPEALYLTYKLTQNKKYLEVAEKSLNFLTKKIFIDNKICLIGQNGWCKKSGERAFFDQQPIDASSLVETYLTAFSITKNPDYETKANKAIQWFFGKNPSSKIVYDKKTGGCCDGIGEHSLNLNQGAESTLSYLTARLFMEEAKKFNKII